MSQAKIKSLPKQLHKDFIHNLFTVKSLFIVLVTVLLTVTFHLSFKYFKSNFVVGMDTQKVKCLDAMFAIIKLGKPEKIERGHVIAFYSDDRQVEYFKKGTLVAKKVVGLPGDEIVYNEEDNSYLVNGLNLEILYKDRWLKPIKTHFRYTGKIPDGCYFLAGTHYRSFDSRYWGFVCEKDIIGEAIALF